MPGASGPFRRTGAKALLAAREVTALGPATMAAIALNSLRVERQRRRDERVDHRPATTRTPGQLLAVAEVLDRPGGRRRPRPVGLQAMFDEAELEVVFAADDLVRVTWGPSEPPLPWGLSPDGPAAALPDGSGLPLAPGRPAGLGPVTVTQRHGGTEVASRAIGVTVDPDGKLTYRDAGGRVVRRELPPLRRGESRTLRAVLRPGERVSGLGEQASPADLRGGSYRLWNRDPGGAWGPGQDPLYCGVPVYVGLHPDNDVLVFHQNPFDARVTVDDDRARVGPPAALEVTFRGGMLRHWVGVGPLPLLLDRYSALTGRPSFPPRWALGYQQCRWGYKDEADVQAVVDGFAAEGLPLSAVHLDIDYMDGYRVFSIDRHRFPDLGALVAAVGRRGTQVVTIVDPAIRADPDYDVYREGVDGGHFVRDEDGQPLLGTVWPGWAAFPDFTDPDARTWWRGLYRRLTDAGVAGIWHDMNEPTSITLWGDRTLPSSARHANEGRGGDHREAHNVYGILMDEVGYEALAEARPGKRPVVVSRAGWAGVQRWAFNWTADIEATWDGLRQQVATLVGLGLSGIPYSGCDIGGFNGIPTPELYVRWLELSVLLPFCRTHSVVGAPPREPWRWPEPHRSAVGRLIRFRYRLLPYLYTAAREAAERGTPMVRPLAWPAPSAGETAGSSPERRLWHVDDAFFLGPSLLAAPVTRPSTGGRPVPLPAGGWYHWRPLPSVDDVDGASGPEAVAVAGGRTTRLEAGVGQPLLAVRAGRVLPLDDHYTAGVTDDGRLGVGHEPRVLALHCFPDDTGRATGEHFDDAGDGDRPHRLDKVTVAPVRRATHVRWARDGDYRLPEELRVVVHGVEAAKATADGTDVAFEVIRPDGGDPVTTVTTAPFERLVLAPPRRSS
ncbi:MAG TPA: TIM-barrel domain-containing protein [Acidimicrobiales bacterium]|nr:TIM-barrel domain-containing protein [Acidimicrobiales bacterium]